MDLSPWLAVLAGMVLAAVVAYGIGWPALRLKGHYLAMATLGFGMIVYIVFNEFIGLTGRPFGFRGNPSHAIGLEISSTLGFYYLCWALAVGVLWLSLNIVNSRAGSRASGHSRQRKSGGRCGNRYHSGQGGNICG